MNLSIFKLEKQSEYCQVYKGKLFISETHRYLSDVSCMSLFLGHCKNARHLCERFIDPDSWVGWIVPR